MWFLRFQVLLLLSSRVPKINAAPSVSATFSNAIQYQFDTDGNAIDLTSGRVDYLGGSYIWYGLTFGTYRGALFLLFRKVSRGVTTGTSSPLIFSSALETCLESNNSKTLPEEVIANSPPTDRMRGVFCGITSYSSSDLQTWHFNGFLFDPNTSEIQTLCAAPLSGNCGRPHIVYSAKNNDYVLWVNQGIPGYVLFTSPNPISGYTLEADRALLGFQPPGPFQGGDFSVQKINGTGYIAYSLIDFSTVGASIWPPFLQSIYVQQLTPDMRNTSGAATHVISAAGDLVDFEAESPDIFQRGDYYYITASNTCGFCTGTLLIVYRSKTLSGPWQRQIISGDTCGGQSEGVLTLPLPAGGPTSYIHISDLFATAPLTGTRTAAHGHQFQALLFNSDGTVQDLDCSLSKTVTISFSPGYENSTGGLATTATDSSNQMSPYSVSCNLPTYQLYQTWSSSKTGNLAEVGVNIAGDTPTGNLSITIFRFQNNTNFFTPRYVWETLASISIPPANISHALEVVRVPVNMRVEENDRLGIALVSESITPMCTMVRNSTDVMFDLDSNTRTLFAIGANQVSLRGKEGKTPPLVVMAGQEIKWYAIVN